MALDYITLNMPEDRVVALQLQNKDGGICTPFDLTGATEIQIRLKKTDGTMMIKTMVTEAPLLGGVSITNALYGQITFAVNAADQIAKGERQDFTVVVHKGVIATAVHGGVTFKANEPGIDGNSITLVFDGIKTVAQVLAVWNTANPDNQVHYLAPETGLSILSASTITLASGTSDRRNAIFRKALTVNRISL